MLMQLSLYVYGSSTIKLEKTTVFKKKKDVVAKSILKTISQVAFQIAEFKITRGRF